MRLFERSDFAVFQDATLTGRLAKIKAVLDPKFEQAAPILAQALTSAGAEPQYPHIAKHLRRHKNPPPDTWVALSGQKRGYKMAPHLELGFWDDRLFLWVAMLAESKPRQVDWPAVSAAALALPEPFELALDHTQKAVLPLDAANLLHAAKRFDTVAKSEWLIGQTYLADDRLFARPDELWADLVERTTMLAPLYALINSGE